MMAFPRWLLVLIVLLHCIQNKGVVAKYRWNCSEPDEHGLRYIPGVREFDSNVQTGTTNGHEIHLYRVQNLTAECTGEVTAIEFCYRYHATELGEAVFNWTVLFLDEEDKITMITTIESHPDSLPENDCQNDTRVPGTINCCDRDNITSFDLDIQINDFVFGVTESAQGNTHSASLLGAIYELEPKYSVDTMLVTKAGLNMSVGSTIFRPSGVPRGLRMLWFIIGNTTTARSTSANTDRYTTVSPISDSTTSSKALITTSTATATFSSSSSSQQLRAQVDVGVVVGSIIGTVVAIILLSAVIVLTLALVHLARKYKSVTKGQLQGTRIAMAQNTYTLDMEMNSNDAYAPFMSRLDSMESNAAYGGTTAVNQESNNVYETIKSIDTPGEDITEAHDSTETNQNEDDLTGSTVYEYIDEDSR